MATTIEVKFDKAVLPSWARSKPNVVEKCKNNLSYRADVCGAKGRDKQWRKMLIKQAN